MTITRRKVVDKLRKQGRQVPTTDLDGATVEKFTADGCFEPAWEIEWHNNLLQAATDQLRLAVTPRSFQIFDWTVRMGRSTKETAEAFGISTVLVRVTKYRVLRKFKSILQRLEKEPWPKGCRP
jgi:DNA-directed RNA polymerase specialized sigma24 family protein